MTTVRGIHALMSYNRVSVVVCCVSLYMGQSASTKGAGCHKCTVYCVNIKCTVCSVQCAVGSLQCAVCSVQCAVCSAQCAVCSVQCVVCSVQCDVLSVRCAVCSVQCAVYTGNSLHLSIPAVSEMPVAPSGSSTFSGDNIYILY